MKMNRQESGHTYHQGNFFYRIHIVRIIFMISFEPPVSFAIFSDQIETGSDVLEPRKRCRGSPMSQV